MILLFVSGTEASRCHDYQFRPLNFKNFVMVIKMNLSCYAQLLSKLSMHYNESYMLLSTQWDPLFRKNWEQKYFVIAVEPWQW